MTRMNLSKEELRQKVESLQAENEVLRNRLAEAKPQRTNKNNPSKNPTDSFVLLENGFRIMAERQYGVFFTTDNKGIITKLSSASLVLFGYAPEEMIGQNFTRFLIEPMVNPAVKVFQETLLTGVPAIGLVLTIRKKNGGTLVAELNASQIRMPDGELGTIGSIKDITVEKEKLILLEAHRKLSDFSLSNSLDALLETILEEAKRITGSTDASFFFPGKDESVGNIQSVTGKRRGGKKGANSHLSGMSSMQRQCIDAKQPAVDNMASQSKNKERELLAPVIRGDKVVAIIEVSGKATDYDNNDILLLNHFADTTWDIVHRKRLELNLVASEKKFRTIIEHAVAGVVIVDRDYRIKFANEQFQKMMGYSAGELLLKELVSIIPPEDIERFGERKMNRAAGKSEQSEQRLIRKDGSLCWALVSATPMSDDDGNFSGAFSLVTDISGKKLVEEALFESEERLRTFSENTLIGIYRTTPSGQIIMANSALLRMLGFTSFEELSQRNLEKAGFSSEYQRGDFKEIMERDGQISGYEAKWKCLDGSFMWVSETAFAVRDAKNEILYYDGTVENITERKLVEKSLTESEERYRTIFEQAGDYALLLKQTADALPVIVDMNQAAAEEFGYELHEIIGKSLSCIDPDITLPVLAEYLEKCRNEKKAFIPLRHLRKDGTIFEVEGKIKTVHIHGENYILSIERDVTALKLIEKENILLAQTLRSVKDCVSITDLQNNLLFVNDAFVETYGFDRDELIGYNIKKVSGNSVSAQKTEEIKSLTGANGWHGEITNVTKAGRYFPVELWTSMVNDKNGAPIAMVGVARDITERKQAAAALHENEELLFTLINSMPDIVCFKDGEGRWLVANDFDLRLFQLEGVDYKHKKDSELAVYSDFYREAFLACEDSDERAWRAGHIDRGEEIIPRPDGAAMVFDIIKQPIFTPDGKRKGLIVVGRDITDRKEAEEKIRESDERLKLTLEAAHIVTWGIDKNNDMYFENGPVVELFGPSKGFHDTDSFMIRKSIHPEDLDLVESAAEQARQHDGKYETEFRILLEDGSYRWIGANGKLIKRKDESSAQLLGVARDITHRKLADEQLRQSEKLFKTFFEMNPLGVAFVAEDKTIIQANNSFVRIFGYEYAEVINHYLPGFSHPDDRLWSLAKVNEFNGNDESTLQLEKRYLKKDGSTIWAFLTVLKLGDENGNFLYNIVVIEDITDRKLAAQNLQESEAKYRLLAENMSDVIWRLDLKTKKFTYVSPSILQLRGYTAEEVMQQSFEECLTPESFKQVEEWSSELFGMLARGEDLGSFTRLREVSQPRKDGSIVWTEVATSYVLDEDNIPIEFLGVSRDITYRKDTERELLRLKTAVETSGELIFQTDRDGIIIYVNPAFCKLYGYAPEEIIGKVTPRILKSGKHSLEFYEQFWSGLLEGRQMRVELENKTKDGRDVFIEASVDPILDDQKTVYGFVAIQHDITERKRAERELILAKEQAEEAVRVKSNFLSNMSHEIRTPMIGILGYSELLKDRMTEPDSKLMAQRIFEGGKRLLGTLNLILDLSRLEARKYEKKITKVDVVELISLVTGLFQSFADKKNIDLRMVSEVKEYFVYSDSRILNEILNNLINNAIKYTDAGSVTVTLDLSEAEQYDVFKIVVSDTGIGIPAESLGVIFEEFRQVSEGRNRAFEGTGLGLAITKKFVEKLSGTIRVESTPQVGSRFIVTLPLSSEPGLSAKADNISLANAKNREPDTGVNPSIMTRARILIVENEPTNASLIEDYLRADFDIKHADNAVKALRLISAGGYDLILMDINLGAGMDGAELTQVIKNMPEYEKIPIIAMTAFAMDGDREEFLEKGCDDYIAKPFYRDELKSLIRKYISV